MHAFRASARRLALAASVAAAVTACSDTQPPPVASRATIADTAEQIMFGVRSVLLGDGIRRAELFSDTAYFFDQGTRIELRGVRTTFFTEAGALDGTLTSREGTFNNRAQVMQARGNVVVQSQDGRRLTSPELRFLITENLIRSDSSFVLTRPGERLTGVGFTSDPNLRNVRIERTTSGFGGSFTLPGQRP
jgi:LPS export ABC transporter protein LptC